MKILVAFILGTLLATAYDVLAQQHSFQLLQLERGNNPSSPERINPQGVYEPKPCNCQCNEEAL